MGRFESGAAALRGALAACGDSPVQWAYSRLQRPECRAYGRRNAQFEPRPHRARQGDVPGAVLANDRLRLEDRRRVGWSCGGFSHGGRRAHRGRLLPMRRGRGLCRRHYERRGRWPSRGGSDYRFVRIKKRNGRLARAVRFVSTPDRSRLPVRPERPFGGTLGYRSRCSLCASLAVFHIEMKIIFEHRRPQRPLRAGGETA